MKENRIVRNCIECNKPFSISENEQKWLKDRKLELFKRCGECRKKRKTIKNNIVN